MANEKEERKGSEESDVDGERAGKGRASRPEDEVDKEGRVLKGSKSCCRTAIGNANFPAICRYVGETEVRTLRPQVNSTEVDNPRTWATYSVCEILAERSRYGQPIRCVAIHPAYANPTMSSSTEVRFDVRCE